jgi:hypothetical protein
MNIEQIILKNKIEDQLIVGAYTETCGGLGRRNSPEVADVSSNLLKPRAEPCP